jgi:hypothetical protein
MLSFDKWKQQFNENFGLLGGVIGGIRNPNSVGSPIAQGNIDTNAFGTLGDSIPENAPTKKWMGTEIKMEKDDEEVDNKEMDDEEVDNEEMDDEEGDDEEMDDEEGDDIEEVDMEDVEEEEGDDEEDEDSEEEDDEMSMEPKDSEEDDMIHHHHMHHHHHMQEEGAKHSKKWMEDGEKEKCMKCGSMMKKDKCMKCGAYMKEESVSYSRIPSLDEWQKSVSSMYDPKFFDKKFDGITMMNEDIQANDAIMTALNNLDKKLGTKSTPFYMEVLEEIFNKMLPKLNEDTSASLKSKMKKMIEKL